MAETGLWESYFTCQKLDGTTVEVIRSKVVEILTPDEWEAYRAEIKAEFVAMGCAEEDAERAAAKGNVRVVGTGGAGRPPAA